MWSGGDTDYQSGPGGPRPWLLPSRPSLEGSSLTAPSAANLDHARLLGLAQKVEARAQKAEAKAGKKLKSSSGP